MGGKGERTPPAQVWAECMLMPEVRGARKRFPSASRYIQTDMDDTQTGVRMR